jgi:hypothetical protein
METTSEWAQRQAERIAEHVAEALRYLARAQKHLEAFKRIAGVSP